MKLVESKWNPGAMKKMVPEDSRVRVRGGTTSLMTTEAIKKKTHKSSNFLTFGWGGKKFAQLFPDQERQHIQFWHAKLSQIVLGVSKRFCPAVGSLVI